jgi:hypothetical protein
MSHQKQVKVPKVPKLMPKPAPKKVTPKQVAKPMVSAKGDKKSLEMIHQLYSHVSVGDIRAVYLGCDKDIELTASQLSEIYSPCI